MSLEDVAGERTVADEAMDFPEDWTVSDLVQIFGEEATRRGIQYMNSLVQADEEYRQSANPEDLDEGWEEGYDVEDIDTEASDKWAKSMEEKGLGIDE